jgi:hypothetical protein
VRGSGHAESLRRGGPAHKCVPCAGATGQAATGNSKPTPVSGVADGDGPDRIAMAIFATLQGLAALITSGMSGDRAAGALITGTIRTLVNGLRPR